MIIGFNYSKIAVDKKTPITGKVEITRDLIIKDMKEEKIQDKSAILVSFEFNVAYEPKIASIDINGNVLYMTEEAKSIIAEWKKSKKLSNEKMTYDVVNTILTKCDVKSLQLSEEMNLPPAIKLPRVVPKEEKDKSFAG